MRKHAHARGVWGYASSRKLDALRLLLRPFLAQRLRMYDSNLYRRPHALQWPLLKVQTSDFPVLSTKLENVERCGGELSKHVATMNTLSLIHTEMMS